MDESNATRVDASPAATERGDDERRAAVKGYIFSLRVSTTHSAKFVTGLLVDTLRQRDIVVESAMARFDQQPLASYVKPRPSK